MPPKRKRDASSSSKGLAPGEPLKRTAHAIAASSWGWVATEVTEPGEITARHLSATCGLSTQSSHPFCRNKYAKQPARKGQPKPRGHINGEMEDDIIVISSDDDEDLNCTKKLCKNNPNCLNYLGQKKWENEEDARELFMKVANIGSNPAQDARDEDLPIGLKNLGATCYANASLQVWFRDMAFRSGVYNCQPIEGSFDKFKDSPTFQLQVTFAALQESTQSVFNPTKLVESLELRTTEQQDAQEFSKLFMSHLDAEFKKQKDPALQSLITDQFQGKQVYGTICSNCGTVSARDSDFLEIEINFKNNAKLEDSIADLLQEEKLSGDNQYLCSACESLQDATRYTELASLPPVLHFSLLRFVYDLATSERRKSKHTISFPTTIDMTRFLGNTADRNSPSSKSEGNIYELRGVLLHKGKSAYHGHYEAQVFDFNKGSWFQFNDEIVTKIKKLGEKEKLAAATDDNKNSGSPSVIDVEVEDEESAQISRARSKQRENARKRRRVEDSDEEASSSLHGGVSRLPVDPEIFSRIYSKDAYMLIYARREPCAPTASPAPPQRALAVVTALNLSHDNACASYAEKEKKAEARFVETRRKVLDIYRSWSVTSSEKNYVIASQQSLESWLDKHVILSALHTDVHSTSPEMQSISIKDVLCSHNLLDPRKAPIMKRITLEAYNKLISQTHCIFSPNLTSADICRTCVEESFTERLYQKQHPAIVAKFDSICNVDNEPGYWISKPWLKDWKLAKPKMHVAAQGDPPPDSAEFQPDVLCEHGGLCLVSTNRSRISVQAFNLIRSLYQTWEPLSGDTEPCLICDGLKNMGLEDRLEVRRRADEEKAKLRHMHENALNGNISLLSDVPCALIAEGFVRAWHHWLSQPTQIVRPDRIDNSPFICEHGLLAFDPNCPNDTEGLLIVIQRSDWDELKTMYPGGPLIAVQKSGDSQYTHEVAICTGCRQERKTNWETTDITIRTKGRERNAKPPTFASSARTQATYTSGARQSKRLRQEKEGVRIKLAVHKAMTLKEIKVELQKQLKIPTICQRLFYGGNELDDNTATVAFLQIHANGIIDLKEVNEVHEISDSEEVPTSKKRRDEGGFGGTLLGRTDGRSSSPPKPVEAPTEKACRTCTFSNPVGLLACGMCNNTV
ncbi:cysteine proteinase [Mycena belliarum]|uniref:ubiquitinyl hydrolase 1 n=1 Tax=Mycena belliarum TaxID=1033014 RepID=A0AAD6XWC6_9AGAR|nr:cysteine proteinase [Mycena belliae]